MSAESLKRKLTAYRKFMSELIQQHCRRVIDSPGDNILGEFASVVDAVECSVAVHNEFKARNAEHCARRAERSGLLPGYRAGTATVNSCNRYRLAACFPDGLHLVKRYYDYRPVMQPLYL